jgi:hypothetical protein
MEYLTSFTGLVERMTSNFSTLLPLNLINFLSSPPDEFKSYYIPQAENWDCGVACASMIICWCSRTNHHSLSRLDEIKTSKSWVRALWSIDIFIYLVECGVNARFYTNCLGVDKHHEEILWYSSNDLEVESVRIKNLFRSAAENSWHIEKVFMQPFYLIILTLLRKRLQFKRYREH